jgi:hypothetical protein
MDVSTADPFMRRGRLFQLLQPGAIALLFLKGRKRVAIFSGQLLALRT